MAENSRPGGPGHFRAVASAPDREFLCRAEQGFFELVLDPDLHLDLPGRAHGRKICGSELARKPELIMASDFGPVGTRTSSRPHASREHHTEAQRGLLPEPLATVLRTPPGAAKKHIKPRYARLYAVPPRGVEPLFSD